MSALDVSEQIARRSVHQTVNLNDLNDRLDAIELDAPTDGDTLKELADQIDLCEITANKSTDIAADTGSNTKFPSVAAVETAIDNAPGGGASIESGGYALDASQDGGPDPVVLRISTVTVTGSNISAVNDVYAWDGTVESNTHRKNYFGLVGGRKALWDNAAGKWKVKTSSGTTTLYESTDDVDSLGDVTTWTAVAGGATGTITTTSTATFSATGHHALIQTGVGARIGATTRVLDSDGTYISVDPSGNILFNAFGFQIQIDGSGFTFNGKAVDFGVDNSGGVGFKVLRVPN